jgi:hypothetical protein
MRDKRGVRILISLPYFLIKGGKAMSNKKALKGLKFPGLNDVYYVPDINQVVYGDVVDNENIEDITSILLGWLKSESGEKFAPKTLVSQVQTSNGTSLEDFIDSKIANIKIVAVWG